MTQDLRLLIHLLLNMGFPYVLFRLWFEIQKRTGLLLFRFPKHTEKREFVSLNTWRSHSAHFPIPQYRLLSALRTGQHLDVLVRRVNGIYQSKFEFFNWITYKVPDWHTHPLTNFRYDPAQHWSEIPDFSPEAGDIKYVWEKSRFCFLYDLIRFDFYIAKDQSKMVFDTMNSWIDDNSVNCGPNWKCSQEITLRVLNWTFALQYYKHSDELTGEKWQKILNSIYRQMQHVEDNIQFSRISVRNNHALTETLGLYLVGLLYPFFPDSKRWKEKGKRWFEEEIVYQIDEGGTFLQASMNYHRIVIQLMTWAITIAELNGESWNEIVYDRARKSLTFLRSCQDDQTGWLPHYGNNDGALFFPLTDCHFRDFRPQLHALAQVLRVNLGYQKGDWEEESLWLGVGDREQVNYFMKPCRKPVATSGYYILKETCTLTFIRCASYKNRPFQADNLHLDIWVNGDNILQDAGSYSYYTDPDTSRYFMGTASHNTVMLDHFDQMEKGTGFIWKDWIKRSKGNWREDREEGECVFEGCFEGFKSLGRNIWHHRRVTKKAGILHWVVEDRIENLPPSRYMHQLWHPSDTFFEHFSIRAFDYAGREILPTASTGWLSDFYGQKRRVAELKFSTDASYIRTVIQSCSVPL